MEILERGRNIADEIGLDRTNPAHWPPAANMNCWLYRADDIHRLLGESVEVFAQYPDRGGELWTAGSRANIDTHKALLIAIRPIEPPKCETRVQELERAIKELLDMTDHWVGREPARERARALLVRNGDAK